MVRIHKYTSSRALPLSCSYAPLDICRQRSRLARVICEVFFNDIRIFSPCARRARMFRFDFDSDNYQILHTSHRCLPLRTKSTVFEWVRVSAAVDRLILRSFGQGVFEVCLTSALKSRGVVRSGFESTVGYIVYDPVENYTALNVIARYCEEGRGRGVVGQEKYASRTIN